MKRPPLALVAPSVVFAVVSAAPASILVGQGNAGTRDRSAHIFVVLDRSFCVSSGIVNHRTGGGIARFYFTLRNTGRKRDKVNVTPVLVYDDGTITTSARNTLMGVVVPARSVRTYRSPAYKYRARSHTILGCGLLLNGRRAVPINYI